MAGITTHELLGRIILVGGFVLESFVTVPDAEAKPDRGGGHSMLGYGERQLDADASRSIVIHKVHLI